LIIFYKKKCFYSNFQDIDRKKELNKLNHSILVNFLDLLDLLIKAPENPKREEKIDDLNLLFIHMHHLINEFRPHQARETLRVMLHVQKKKRLQVAEKFQHLLDKVSRTLLQLSMCMHEISFHVGPRKHRRCSSSSSRRGPRRRGQQGQLLFTPTCVAAEWN
jgi:hypothetical protein